MAPKFKFRPLKGAWVALHPKPIGVVQFIGGAFFGTFPTIFYRFLLRQLYAQGYTIVALPYRFTFDHWSVSLGLIQDVISLRQSMTIEAEHLGYESAIYHEDPCAQKRNYFWLGHSLGNKYIALLELLSALELATPQAVLAQCIPPRQVQSIERKLAHTDLHDISLINQPSILMAPAITGIESAIPIRIPAVIDLIKHFIDVAPTVKQTHCLIRKSGLFGLIGLIAFEQDKIAAPTVAFIRNLPKAPADDQSLPGQHLAPLGLKSGDPTIVNTVLKFLQTL